MSIKMKGLAGEVNKVYSSGFVTLTFGKFRQDMNDIVAFDRKGISNSLGTEVSGILGFAMLWKLEIKIDPRQFPVRSHPYSRRHSRLGISGFVLISPCRVLREMRARRRYVSLRPRPSTLCGPCPWDQ